MSVTRVGYHASFNLKCRYYIDHHP